MNKLCLKSISFIFVMILFGSAKLIADDTVLSHFEPVRFLPAETLDEAYKQDGSGGNYFLPNNNNLLTNPDSAVVTTQTETPYLGVPPLTDTIIFNTNKNRPITSTFLPTGLSSQDSLFEICPISSLNFSSLGIIEDINGGCLSRQDNQSFSPDYSRDLGVCACLRKTTPASMERTAYQMGLIADPSSNQNSIAQEAMNENIERMNQLLEAEQNAMQFQASTLPTDDENSRTLTSAFTLRVDVTRDLARVQTEAQRAYNSYPIAGTPGTIPMKPVVVPPPSTDLLATPASYDHQDTACIPRRTFLTARQMPADDMFIQDLASLPANFQPSDWNYHQLQIKFVQMAGRLSANTLSETLQDPEAKKIYLRLQFLQRNPLYRNLFSSTRRDAGPHQQRLLNLIRETYRPGQTDKEKFKSFNDLRYKTGAFFTHPSEMVEIVQQGASENLRSLLAEVPHRVSRISKQYNPAGEWMNARIAVRPSLPLSIGSLGSLSNFGSLNSFNSSGLLDLPSNLMMNSGFSQASENGRRDLEIYQRYCPRLEFSTRQNQFTVLTELEESFGGTYSSRDLANEDYFQENIRLCGLQRANASGETKTWPDYQREICQGQTTGRCHPENQGALLADFIDAYPDPKNGGPTRADLSYLLPFLRGEARIPSSTKEEAAQSLAEGSNRNFMRTQRARTLSSISGQFTESSNELASNPQLLTPRSLTSSFSRPTTSSTASVSQTSGPSSTSQPVPVNPQSSIASAGFVPSGPSAVPVVVPSPQTEQLRTQTRQKESETQIIRDQLGTLKDDIERANARPRTDRNQQVINDLNQKLSLLEEQFRAKNRETEDLRQQLRSSEAEDAARANAVANRTPERDPQSASSRRQELSQISGVPSSNSQVNSGSTGGVQPSLLPGGQAQLGPSSGSVSRAVSGASRSGGTSGGELLRSKYNIESVSGSGAIVVSAASPAIDYQQLREDSGSNVINVPLSSSEFQALSEAEKVQYISQVNALSADVVRVAFSDGEGFFVRDGEQFSLVPAQATPNRAPAAVPERTIKLEDLNRELDRVR